MDFEYRLLNSKGEVTTTFKEGEDITFSLLITNRDPTLRALYNFQPELICGGGKENGYAKVYQPVEGQGEVYWGRAACLSERSCSFESGFPLTGPGYPREIKDKWLYAPQYCNAPSQALPKGKYRTGFTQTFYESRGGKRAVDSNHTTKTFEIYFEVK